jgi:hypothetical protein
MFFNREQYNSKPDLLDIVFVCIEVDFPYQFIIKLGINRLNRDDMAKSLN